MVDQIEGPEADGVIAVCQYTDYSFYPDSTLHRLPMARRRADGVRYVGKLLVYAYMCCV